MGFGGGGKRKLIGSEGTLCLLAKAMPHNPKTYI